MTKLKEAINAIKAGDKNTGRRLLTEILKVDSRNEMAWLWMSQAVTSNNDRIRCLRNVLKINPDNEVAKRGLTRLQQSPLTALTKREFVSERQSMQPTPSKGKSVSQPLPTQPHKVEDDRIPQQKTEKRKKSKFLLYGVASVFILCCVIPFFIATVDVSLRTVGLLPTYTPRPTRTPTLTVTPAGIPTETPVPEPIGTATNTPTSMPTPALPGLNPADVTLSVKEKGANCTSAKEQELYSLKYFVWSCTTDEFGIKMSVDVYARQLQTVDYISAKVYYPDAEVAAPFLGFVATAPYNGAEQYKARAWVEKTLPEIKEDWNVREQTFGGVKFRLSGDAVRHLEMGDLNGIWVREP